MYEYMLIVNFKPIGTVAFLLIPKYLPFLDWHTRCGPNLTSIHHEPKRKKENFKMWVTIRAQTTFQQIYYEWLISNLQLCCIAWSICNI